jgi:hypothetical protein
VAAVVDMLTRRGGCVKASCFGELRIKKKKVRDITITMYEKSLKTLSGAAWIHIHFQS